MYFSKRPSCESLKQNNSLVRERVFRWSSLCNNLLCLGSRLNELGLVYSDAKVIYLQADDEVAKND